VDVAAPVAWSGSAAHPPGRCEGGDRRCHRGGGQRRISPPGHPFPREVSGLASL